MAIVSPCRGRRDISHAGRKKVADEDTRQNGLPVLLTNRVKETLVPGEAIREVGFFGDQDLRFLGLDIGGGLGGDVLAVRRFT